MHPRWCQVSLAWGDGDTDRILPIAVSKPLLRIVPGGRATTELFYQGQGLPQDRESYFVLSVLDVPPAAHQENHLQLAYHHHFKLFYRPALASTPDEAIARLAWEVAIRTGGGRVTAHNPSPYYLTLSEVALVDATGQPCGQAVEHLMLPPFSSQALAAVDCRPARVYYRWVSDGGHRRPHAAFLSPGVRSHGGPELRPTKE
nr:molecular chaperone [Pseudoxanthomonas sp.]